MKRLNKIKLMQLSIILICLICFSGIGWSNGHEVYDLTVKRLGQTTQVILKGNGPFTYKDFVLENPPRIVIDCLNSDHNLPGPRPGPQTYLLERGGIVAIRSSYLTDPTARVRIIIDLEQTLPYVVFKEGKNLIVALDAVTAMPFADWEASKYYEYSRPPRTEAFFYSKGKEVITEPLATPAKEAQGKPAPSADYIPSETAEPTEEQLINVEYENGELVKIIRQFASWTNQNIVISPNVKGTVSVSLRDVPVRTALDMILKINNYAIVEEPGNIWRVTSIKDIQTAELVKESQSDSLESVVPLKTEVIGIQYAAAADIAKSVAPGSRGNILIDDRTNSLIITDTPVNVDRVKSMIKKLDSPTTQVNIEARIVELGSDLSRQLGIKWSQTQSDTGRALISVDFSNKLTEEITKALNQEGETKTSVRLNAVLTALEDANKAHTISKPNVTVLNHQKALIQSGVQLPFFTYDEAGNQSVQLVQTGIKLDVTPHVNPGDRITLEVKATVSSAAPAGSGINAAFAINSKDAQTKVMVDNGSTAVIGGLMSSDESETESRIPFLSKLPIVGRLLFTHKGKTKRTRELLIFLTPKIVSSSPEAMF